MAKKRCLAALALIPLLAQAAELPRKAPEYTINRNGAPPLALSQYKGKPVVLAFILTYCSHCQRTVGFLIKDQNEYGPRGLQVVACAIENGAQLAVPAFLKNFNPTFPVGYNDGSTALEFMQHPMVKMPIMPMLAFIDRQGMIRAQFEGDDEKIFGDQHEQNLRMQIEALLKAPAIRDLEGVAGIIARIEAGPHSSLPSLQQGSGRGPITIQNDTPSVLTVYFSGTTKWKESVPPHGRASIMLNPGAYKVAGELSDKSVRPFAGSRTYSGGETEHFYIAPR